jgi:hypothetical protein
VSIAPDSHLGMTGITRYAEEILSVFHSPIASERIDLLLYMTVGGGRLKVLGDLTARLHKLLKIGQPGPVRGIYFEVVTGEFGAGKSHLAYMLKHNALTSEGEILVSHVQITGEAGFPAALAALLRSLRLSGHPSFRAHDIELAAYRRLFEWCGRNPQQLLGLAYQQAGNVSQAAASDFAQAVVEVSRPSPNAGPLQQFFDSWINRAEPKVALECFELVFRLFRALNSQRFLLIIDEFEAIQSLDAESRKHILQAFQDLHDDFAGRKQGLPGVHLVCFSTRDWTDQAGNILPSLMGRNQRIKRVTHLPDMDESDIAALMYRYLSLYQIARQPRVTPTRQALHDACGAIVAEVADMPYHMRSIHAKVRERVEDLLGL